MIHSFYARNYCQHEDLTCEFDPRMTAILGPNGSGKSNILSGIIGALANEWINSGKKEENITYGTEGASSVQVDFSHDGFDYTARRFLKGGKSSVKCGNGNPVTGESEVTDYILGALGISKRMLLDYVLVRQGAISGILSTTPAERGRAFQWLFGTARCEEIYKATLPFVQKLSVDVDLSQIDELRSSHEKLLGQEEDLNVEIAGLDSSLPEDKEIEKAKERLQNNRRIQQIEHRLGEILSLKNASSTESLERDVVRYRESIASLEEAIEKLGPESEEARVQLRLLEQYNAALNKREGIQKEVASMEQELEEAKDNKPVPPSEARPSQEELSRIYGSITQNEKLIEALDSDQSVQKCPLCETVGVNIGSIKSRLEGELSSLGEEKISINVLMVKWDEYGGQEESYELYISELKQKIEVKRASMPPLDEKAPDNQAVDQFHEAIQKHEDSKDTLRAIQEKLAQIEHQVSSEKARRQALEEEEYRLRQEVGTLERVDDEEELRSWLESVSQTKEQIASKKGELKAICGHIEHVQRSLKALEEQRDRHVKALSMAKKLEAVRQAYHRDNVPAEVSRAYLRALVDGSPGALSVNDLLDTFDSPFRVSVREEDLSFWAEFDTGSVQAAERLSGGEKVVLSLALRTAINSLFASHLSMLFLDEPTEYLDDANLNCLQTALERLGQLADDKGMQVIVITHEKELAPLFDKVIQL